MEWPVRGSKPLGSVTFFIHQVPPSLQYIGYSASFLGVEGQGCIVDHPAFSAEIFCGQSYISASPLLLRGM